MLWSGPVSQCNGSRYVPSAIAHTTVPSADFEDVQQFKIDRHVRVVEEGSQVKWGTGVALPLLHSSVAPLKQ